MTLPNFIIAGAAKSGTTSLAYYLSQHPDIYINFKIETRFFSKNYDKGIKYYETTFFDNVEKETAIGETDVTYFIRPHVAERIKNELGNIKLIFLLRNPVERAFSGFLMGYRKGRFKNDFMNILLRNQEQLEEYYSNADKNDYLKIKWESELLQCGHYYDNIKNYEKHFSKDNLKIIIFNDFVGETDVVYTEICQFLDVCDYTDKIAFTIKNPYISKKIYKLKKIIRFIPKNLRNVMPNKMKETLYDLTTINSHKPQCPNHAKEWLINYYHDHNKKLSEYLGRDLSNWGI